MANSGQDFIKAIKSLRWSPDMIYQVGVGKHYPEVKAFQKEWPEIPITGCEPHPSLYKRLTEKYPGKIYNIAMGEVDGSVDLYHRKKHKDGSSVFQRKYDPNRPLVKHRVVCSTLDTFFCDKIVNALLWLDCEGSELRVLRGGKEFLKGVSVINVEVIVEPPCDGWCSACDVNIELVRNGFVLRSTHTHRDNHNQYDAVYVRSSLC